MPVTGAQEATWVLTVSANTPHPFVLGILQQLRDRLDPFALAETIHRKLARIHALAITPRTLSPEERHALGVLTAWRPAPTHPWRRSVTPLMTR